MEFKLGAVNVYELGRSLSEKLMEYGVMGKQELIIYLGENNFRKLDEDLFYRNKTDDGKEFTPSDNEIDINFDLVKIIVKKKMIK